MGTQLNSFSKQAIGLSLDRQEGSDELRFVDRTCVRNFRDEFQENTLISFFKSVLMYKNKMETLKAVRKILS